MSDDGAPTIVAPGAEFAAVKTRHRLLVAAGVAATVIGVLLAGYVGYDWFVNRVSHEVIAVVSAFGILLGVQLIVLSSLSSMLIALHREQLHEFDRRRNGNG